MKFVMLLMGLIFSVTASATSMKTYKLDILCPVDDYEVKVTGEYPHFVHSLYLNGELVSEADMPFTKVQTDLIAGPDIHLFMFLAEQTMIQLGVQSSENIEPGTYEGVADIVMQSGEHKIETMVNGGVVKCEVIVAE